MTRYFLLLLCTSCVWFHAFAQKNTPPLERIVSLSANDETVSSILEKITQQTGIKFSYNPEVVKTNLKKSITVNQKPLRIVLSQLFGDEIQFKQNGNFVILSQIKPQPGPTKNDRSILNIHGYIFSENNKPIPYASIYNREHLIASVSNQYGYYTLNAEVNQFPVMLKVAKENFVDTQISVDANAKNIDITLTPQTKNITIPPLSSLQIQVPKHDSVFKYTATLSDTIPNDSFVKVHRTFLQGLLLSSEIKSNLRNISDTLFTKTQVGLVPYISTNKLLSGNTINDYSFNILIGYSQGVNKFEIGGLMNIDRQDVKSFQAAGLINAVGGNVNGIQLAGIGNITKGKSDGLVAAGIFNMGSGMHGIQLAGICNINISYPKYLDSINFSDFCNDTVSGIQASGIVNINPGHTEGLSIGGILNVGNTHNGFQVGGLMNGNWGVSNGLQVAGLTNIMLDTTNGDDIAGLVNINLKQVTGSQISGLLNIVYGDVTGAQITSLVNIAHHVNGTQIALLNFSDSAKGLPFGFISIVANGYHKLEVFGDDILFTQLAIRTGVSKFHNIFNAGIDLTQRTSGLWNLGYGVGSTLELNNGWNITTDIIVQSIIKQNQFENAPTLGNLFIGIEKRFSPYFSLSVGPTYHAMMQYGPDNNYTAINASLIPYSFYDKTYTNGNTLNMWVGGKISLKFM